jgi:hypothetical protein
MASDFQLSNRSASRPPVTDSPPLPANNIAGGLTRPAVLFGVNSRRLQPEWLRIFNPVIAVRVARPGTLNVTGNPPLPANNIAGGLARAAVLFDVNSRRPQPEWLRIFTLVIAVRVARR